MYTRVIKWVFLCKIPDLCSKNWTDTCAVCLAIEGTQGASATLGRPATHLTGHIFTTISHISSGLRPCALVNSGMVLFTFATLHLDLAVHNPLDWFILPHELKQLDIFSAGQQHTETSSKTKLFAVWTAAKTIRENIFLKIAICTSALPSSYNSQRHSCHLNLWSGPVARFLVLAVLHGVNSLGLRDR